MRQRGAVLFAFIALVIGLCIGTFALGYFANRHGSSTPPNGVVPVFKLDPDNPNYQTVSQATTFDLSSWTPEAEIPNRWTSPVVMQDEFTVHKIGESQAYNAYYSTSGQGIDLTCTTHPYLVEKKVTPHNFMGKAHEQEYVVKLDDHATPVGSISTIGIRGVYYNAFRASDDLSTFTDSVVPSGLTVRLTARFPLRTIKSMQFIEHEVGSKKIIPIDTTSEARVTFTPDGNGVVLQVLTPKPNFVYTIKYELGDVSARPPFTSGNWLRKTRSHQTLDLQRPNARH